MNTAWVYKCAKRDPDLIAHLWEALLPRWRATGVAEVASALDRLSVPQNDDELDAIVGWVLGVLLAHRHPSVAIVGDATTGSFVLPVDEALLKAFESFCDEERGLEAKRRAS